MLPYALVTPASRGLGLELARRLLQTSTVPVVATARHGLDQTKEKLLTGLHNVSEDRLHVLKLDVLAEDTVADAAKTVSELFPQKDSYLHLALCLPGLLFPEKAPSQIDYDDALLTFRTNTLGPMLLMKHFFPLLPRKATCIPADLQGLPERAVWAMWSARVGSTSDNRLGGWYSYRASKAAVNSLAKTFDNHLRTTAGDNAMSISMHPGTVKTDLSKEFWNNVKADKLFSPEFAAEKGMEVIMSRRLNDRGRCWDWKGDEILP